MRNRRPRSGWRREDTPKGRPQRRNTARRRRGRCEDTEHLAAKGGTVRRCGTTVLNCGTKPSRIKIVPGGVYGGDGAIFASENPIFQSKNRFFAVSAPENPQDFSGNWRGARRPRAVRETGRSKPNEQRSFASGSAARRLLRIVEGGSGGGARSARPVGEAARSKPNEQGSTASRQAQQDDHCELWGACSPVHQLVKKTFLTS